MYPQVQASDNTPMYIGIAVLALLIVGGILLYVFVFKCKEDGSECTTTSDCCEGLECVDSKCSSSTPTVSPQPVVVNNVNPEPDPEPEPEPEPELTTCADWDVDNDCATETTLTPGNVIGNSQSDCCVSALDCEGTWSACTAACESADERTFTQTQAQFGTGAECPEATECQPGEDDCPRWVYDTTMSGRSCDTTCANVGLECVDGDWGVHDESALRQILGGDYFSEVCEGNVLPSTNAITPYFNESGTYCRYSNDDVVSECSETVGGSATRICKCVSPVTP